jgi:hypothetical protein
MNRAVNIVNQLPDFVKSDYPVFVDFLKTYYEWLENEHSSGRLETITDIDRTAENFLQYFRKSLDIYGVTSKTTIRLYLKHIKELYTAKGSSQAFSLFFKILYQKMCTTFEPWDQVFIPSNAKWVRDVSIFIDRTNYEVTVDNDEIVVSNGLSYVVGDGITLIDNNTSYKVFVEDVKYLTDTVVELKIHDFYIKESSGPIIAYDSVGIPIGKVISIPTTIDIVLLGTGFTVGQCFNIRDMVIRVKSVDEFGRIKYFEIIKFGIRFNETEELQFSISSGGIKSFNFDPYFVVNTSTNTITTRLTSDLLEHLMAFDPYTADNYGNPHGLRTGDQVIYEKGLDTNTPIGGLISGNIYYAIYVDQDTISLAETFEDAISNNIIDLSDVGSGTGHKIYLNNSTIVNFGRGYKCIYPGYYNQTINTLGDLDYIEDLYYYQKFSYVVDTDLALEEYREQLQQVLHPTGLKQFSNWRQVSSLNPSYTSETNTSIIRPIIPDGYKFFDPILINSSIQTEVTYNRNINDNISITSYIEPVLVSAGDKYEDNYISATDSGYATVQPSSGGYVNTQYPDEYWQFGYIVGEIAF